MDRVIYGAKTEKTMNEATLGELERLFLAMSDKTRLRLLELMAGGEVSVGYLADALNESQPKISRHLAYLRTAGVVSTRRDGKWVYYGIEKDLDDAVARVIAATFQLSDMGSEAGTSGYDRAEEGDAYRPRAENEQGDERKDYGEWAPAEMDVWLL